ncbi:S41 family peptidase [Temperatibacter marinus]|uniref:S41 family peptidase n=1 Tax=Temperatibacter marinus TaxID=1456591 RepID=A0AA52EB13_9PROT|nr:S41 family peptidase [Temperatibacter marinus]WND01440.1 S41 family peptidase [Temperatibacter marinus]
MMTLKKPFTLIKSALIAATLGTTMLASPLQADGKRLKGEELYTELDVLIRVLKHMREDYVDADIDDKKALESAIQAMLKSLDPHSNYINMDNLKNVQMQVRGEYGGLGIEVSEEKDVVKVVSPIDDTPAQRAGIKSNDYITHINGEDILGKGLDYAISKMRGAVGEPINITIVRVGVEDPFDVKIVRDNIKIRSARHRVEDDTIGYIRISTFNMQTWPSLKKSIDALHAELGDKMQGVVLDLRNNPGGLLSQAIKVSDTFLEQGEIVSTRGRHRTDNETWFADYSGYCMPGKYCDPVEGDLVNGLPMVVLTNAGSASASEIVAGALQDHRRAIILGDRSFGKGTVQSQYKIFNRALRLTTARYYTPSGNSIQGRGIEPDIEVLFPAEQRYKMRREADLRNTISNDSDAYDRSGELEEMTFDKDAKIEPAQEDIQLKYAIRLLKGLYEPAPEQTVAKAELPDKNVEQKKSLNK